MGIFSFVKPGKKTFDTISSVKPNVPKTKLDKAKSKLAIVKQKTKASKAKLNQTLFNIDQASKKAKEVAKDKRNEKIVKKFIGEKFMKSFLIVISICIFLLAGISLTLSFWQIPIPITEKTLTIPNEYFNK